MARSVSDFVVMFHNTPCWTRQRHKELTFSLAQAGHYGEQPIGPAVFKVDLQTTFARRRNINM